MAKLIPSTKKLKVLDMFAGNGNITKEIDPMHEIYAVEWQQDRVRSGKHRAPNAEWIWDDVFLRSFIDKYVLPGTFDVVIMNPDFKVCITALYLAWAAIRNSKCGDPMVICLSPVTLFNMSEGRKRYYAMTPLWVEYEHQIGKFNYHSDRGDSKKKQHPDSVHVLKLLCDDFDKKYERIVRI